MKKVKVISESIVPSIELHKGTHVKNIITKKKGCSDRIMLGICTLDMDGEAVWTFNDNDEIYYILQGKITLYWNDKKSVAKEGQSVYLPAGLKYRLINTGAKPAKFIFAISPSTD